MKAYLQILLAIFSSFTFSTAAAQCSKDDIYYVVEQPSMVGADTTGNVTFYAKKGGYYIRNVRIWGNRKLFTTKNYPGLPGQVTFTGLTIGVHSFNTFLPDFTPSDIDFPNVDLRELCAHYEVVIEPKTTRTLSVVSTNAANCSSFGFLTINGLPNNTNWGIKFPKQTVFSGTGGATSVTSPAALNLTPGKYLVEVSEDRNNAAAVVYRMYAEIKANTEDCNPFLSFSSTNATANNVQDGTQAIQGFPYQGFTNPYRLFWGRYPWHWDITWGSNPSDVSMPGHYPAVVDDNGNNFLTPGTAIKYTLPISVGSNVAGGTLGASFFLSTVTLPTNPCSNFGVGNGTIQLTGARAMSMEYPNGVMFPGQTTYTAVPINGTVQSPNNTPPGNLAVRINDRFNDANSPSNLYSMGVQSNATGTPQWCNAGSIWVDQQTPAINCGNNGRMRLNGLPNAANSMCYRWPGEANFTLKSTTGTTISSPASFRPGIYNVEVNTSTVAANANAGQGYTYYIPVTITNSGAACAAIAAPTFTTTNVTYVGAADGSITVTVPNALRNTAFGVKFPNVGWMAMLGRNTNTITSPKNLQLPAGTHQVRYVYNVFSTETPKDVNVAIGTGPAGTTHPRAASSYTVAATNATTCLSKNGRMTVSGFYAGEAASVLFPGYSTYLMPNAGETSITSPYFLEYGPGTYTVKVRNNAFDAASTEFTYTVTIGSSTGSCNTAAPSLTVTATNVANCTNDSTARITVSGFSAGQNYGVLFPGHTSFMVQPTNGGSLTSPAGTKIGKGKYIVTVSKDASNLNADFFYMTVIVKGPGNIDCPLYATGFSEDPSCDGNTEYIYLQTFGSTGVTPSAAVNGGLPFGYVTEYNKVDIGCDQPQDNNYSIVNTTNLAGLGCSASYNDRVFGNFQHGTDHSTGNFTGANGAQGGFFVLVNGSFDSRKLFEGTLNTTYVCPNSEYNFSIWARDFEPYIFGNIHNFQTIRPILSFLVNDVEVDRDTLGANVNYAQGQTTQWQRLGFRFRVPASGVVKITVRSVAPGGIGNDFAFDDVSITKCLPYAALRVPVTCNSGGPIVLYPKFTGGSLPAAQFRWTKNGTPISTWENLPGTPFNYSGGYVVGDTFRVEFAENSNVALASCVKNSNYFLMRGYGSSCVVLATDQFTIKGRAAGNVNVIDWSFVHQKSAKRYVLEVSGDNQKFETVKVFVDANLMIGNPSFNHSVSVAQNLYYRVRATLFNDEEVYSSTILVSRQMASNEKLVLVNTIVSKEEINVNSSQLMNNVPVTLTDLAGKVIMNSKINLNKGLTRLKLPMSNLSSGYYIISFLLNDEKISFKILKP